MITPHITLNTEHSQDVDLSTFDDEAMAHIHSIIPQGGALPVPLAAFRVEFAGTPRNIMFTILRGKEMVSISGFSTSEKESKMVWQELQKYEYIAMTGKREVPASKLTNPPKTPWLASVLLRGAAYITPNDTMLLSKAEQLIAASIWYVLENPEKFKDYK